MECLCSQVKSDLSLLEPVLTQYAETKGSLITILQHAQEIYGYLPQDVIRHIAARTGIKPAKIMGVATFYTQFRLQPVGKYLIMLCKGTACHVNGSDLIEKTITEALGIHDGETTEVHSIDDVMNTPFIDGKSLNEVFDELDYVE